MSARSGLPWSDVWRLHVVRKVTEIVGQRWNLGLGYIDARTREVRPPRATSHAAVRGICQVVQDRDVGQRACDATAFETLRSLLAAPTPRALRVPCHAGLFELAAPVVVDGEIWGALLCGGLSCPDERDRDATLADVDARTEPLALSPGDYQEARRRHPWLDEDERSFVLELLEAAAAEIAAFSSAALARRRREDELARDYATRYSYDSIIGKSPPMQELYGVLDRVVQSDSTVLIQGENGTGKELVARAIHHNSDRKHRRFVVTNCSAFNDNLLDSELFGHKRGAFTGAISDKQGLFEVADAGTFFLDEIGDMTPALQVKVLRVLQEGTFTPVGDTEMRTVDVRIIAATNRDLKTMVQRGEFREDLYYRINVINLVIPPLRERREDIAVLIEHFLDKHTKRVRMKSKRLSEACTARLLGYAWPGNVRELENEIERLVVLAGDERVIDEELLSARIRQYEPSGDEVAAAVTRSLPVAVERLERKMILEALQRHKWNKTRAAAELEVSRRNLIRLVQKYDLEKA